MSRFTGRLDLRAPRGVLLTLDQAAEREGVTRSEIALRWLVEGMKAEGLSASSAMLPIPRRFNHLLDTGVETE